MARIFTTNHREFESPFYGEGPNKEGAPTGVLSGAPRHSSFTAVPFTDVQVKLRTL